MPLADYMRDRIGSAIVVPDGEIVAGGHACFELVYTAGFFGIDDSGSLKVVQRFASDMANPQFDDPTASNYVSVEASNGATLLSRYDVKDSIRPWGKTLYVKVVRGYLREGDRIVVRFGDPRLGCPGMRMQTFCEDSFELKVLVDAFATYDYVELPQSPTIRIVAGEPQSWQAILPTLRRKRQPFRLGLKAEDRWGNPSDRAETTVLLTPSLPVMGLPEEVTFPPDRSSAVLEDLSAEETGDLRIELFDPAGKRLAASNPLRIVESAARLPFWGDLHGQSEETIGTNAAADYFRFARDRAFLDVAAHQGNDFQITREFWAHLQQTNRRFHEPGRFVTFPGYEWSGNTGLGGDHNVYYLDEGEPIHRSSHALVYDLSDADTDRHTSAELLETLAGKEAFVFAHVGGRYADLGLDGRSPVLTAVEIHSAWGTFEWLLHDAFAEALRVGVVANSDDHKGRPGASYPGASRFGSYGGLTCFLASELTREAIYEAVKSRHHYATTGARLFLDVEAFDESGKPLGMMGDFLETPVASVTLQIRALSGAPVERVELFNGTGRLHTLRFFSENQLGSRIRVLWEGAEDRGRGRETTWDGSLQVVDNRIVEFTPINFWNPEKGIERLDGGSLAWSSVTTGGFSGVDLRLGSSDRGRIEIHTAVLGCSIEVDDVGLEELVFPAGGLGRQIRIFRLPDQLTTRAIDLRQAVRLKEDVENPLYVRLTQEDGHRAWSSPIYVRVSGTLA